MIKREKSKQNGGYVKPVWQAYVRAESTSKCNITENF